MEEQDQDSTRECKRTACILTAGEKYTPVWRAAGQLSSKFQTHGSFDPLSSKLGCAYIIYAYIYPSEDKAMNARLFPLQKCSKNGENERTYQSISRGKVKYRNVHLYNGSHVVIQKKEINTLTGKGLYDLISYFNFLF